MAMQRNYSFFCGVQNHQVKQIFGHRPVLPEFGEANQGSAICGGFNASDFLHQVERYAVVSGCHIGQAGTVFGQQSFEPLPRFDVDVAKLGFVGGQNFDCFGEFHGAPLGKTVICFGEGWVSYRVRWRQPPFFGSRLICCAIRFGARRVTRCCPSGSEANGTTSFEPHSQGIGTMGA